MQSSVGAPPGGLAEGDAERAGSYLVFHLGREDFAFPAVKVREIMGVRQHKTPGREFGYLFRRGVPVIDLRLAFGLPETGYTGRTCVIVLEVSRNGISRHMAIVVDGVTEVVYLDEEDIEEIPLAGGAGVSAYLRGMTRLNGKLRTLLNIDQVLYGRETDCASPLVQ